MSNSIDDKVVNNNSLPKGISSQERTGELFWDFPESVDRKNKLIIQTGNLENIGSSQGTICNLMQKIRLKGVGRPKKRKGNKNPFDFSLSKKMFKKNRGSLNGNRILPLINKNVPLEGSRKEAQKIVEVADSWV